LGPGAFPFAETSAAEVPFESSFPAARKELVGDDGAGDGAASGRALAESERLLLSGRRGDALEVLARAGLWAQASLLASRMGAAFQRDVAARAARATTAEGSPMRVLALVLAGAADDLLQADDPGAVPGSSAERSNEEKAFKRDDARGLLPRWREHLAILAANASLAPEDSRRVMAALGDALVDSDLFNAHAAFALAGVAPQPFHPAARLCLLGADHTNAPRTYHSDPRAIQATALLERFVCGASSSSGVSGSNPALSSAGQTNSRNNAKASVCFASFQPYKVHYAGLLAEVGATREALALAESVSKTLRSREFLACASSRDGSVNVAVLTQLAGEMEHRLRGNARGTLGGLSLRDLGSAATTLFGGFGKMFDKGVQKVFGDEGVNGEGNGSVVGRLISHSRTHSSASSASNDKAFVAFGDRTDKTRDGNHAENTFDAGGTGGRQVGAFGVGSGSAAAAAAGSAAHSRSASFASDASASAADPGASPSSSAPKGSGSVWRQFSGVLGKVGAAIPLPKPKNQAKLGEENTMYYDEKLGRWVEPGKEGEADAGPPPPPPTTLGASPAAGTGFPAASPGTGASPGIAAAAPFSMRAQKGRSKYVDAFSLSGPNAAAATHPGGGTPEGQQSVFPAGLMPPGVGVSPGLFPPGVPGTFSGPGGAPSGIPPAALMVPSPAPGVEKPSRKDEEETKNLAPLPLSPTSETPSSLLSGLGPDGGLTAARDPDPSDLNETDEQDSLAPPDDEDPESSAFSFDAFGDGARSSPPTVPPPPVAPMKDLRLTDAPDRDRDRDPGGVAAGALASFGDGRVDNPVPARFAGGDDMRGGKTFFLPTRAEKDATGVVGGGATADDADDTIDDADRGSYVREKTNADEDDPFDELGDAEKKRKSEDEDDQNASAQNGFFDREGIWRIGDWPGGERGADGRWHEGYWTQDRFWVAGYWDETGVWREGVRPGGYFDADRGWIPESSAETGRRADDDDDPRASLETEAVTTTSAADVADALGGVAGLGFGGEARDDEGDEMTEIGL
jgi:hypothetical protein